MTSSPLAAATGGGTMATSAAFAAAMEETGGPVLGHLVLYSVYEGKVTRQDLERWFVQLGMDHAFLPKPIREDDAYQRVTGKTGVRSTYKLTTDPTGAPVAGEKVIEVTLMVRHVARDNLKITRHVVREVRDEGSTSLSYDTKMASVEFWFDPTETGRPGCGVLQVHPDHAAINALSESEQARVRDHLHAIEEAYRQQCLYYTSDRLRAIVRSYIESLNAVRVRESGGVYFVHAAHGGPLSALRDLVRMFGSRSLLTRIPIPAEDEMREMIVAAITTKARDDLQKLSAEIAAARAAGHSETQVMTLYRRFTALRDAATEHSQLLSSSLDDTMAALDLVQKQVGSLLTSST